MTDPIPIGAIVSEYMKRKAIASVNGTGHIAAALQDVLSACGISGQAKVLKLNRGVVEIGVGSSGLLHQLTAYHREDVLNGLRDRLGATTIRNVRFSLRTDLQKQ